MRRFVDLADLSRAQVLALLALAGRLEQRPEPQALAGKILGLLFMNPSLRTLASCQAAMARLGGSSFVITPGAGSWQLETREGAVMDGNVAEHIREGLPVLASYCDALGIRSFADGKDLAADLGEHKFNAMARLVDKPLINLESAINHPCQALADWKTLDELGIPPRGKLVLCWAYHPRPLPLAVPAATVHMAAMRGMDVTILRPEGFALPAPILEKARRAAADAADAADAATQADSAGGGGGRIYETSEVREAMSGAHVVYVKEWAGTARYGDEAADTAARRAARHWCLDEDWFAAAPAGCRLMHCLPVRRNVAIADALLDGPRSLVLRQAYNRLPAQMAVLHRLLSPVETVTR
ncbi:MAG TPA: N-acetylornithine carbamoyltransferase [Steroidobacteraceae bacterium]|nr:N-acetylornithine carbamoyltransferase [Steroidobacteraceae bacterium]